MSMRPPLSSLDAQYDLVIVGGGITGAGLLREAVRTGARVLLVEARDFASGTSSWSSKLVHGGLRYLKEGQWRLTLESVRERQRLLREAPGLVEPLPFLMPIRRGARPGRWIMRIGLAVYDLMAGARRSGWLNVAQVRQRVSSLRVDALLGAVHYEDARTDDARLVLRLIQESMALGGTARNYVRANVRCEGGRVTGVSLVDALDGSCREIGASVVVNATGAWAAMLDGAPQGAPTLRPLRGSHLVFDRRRFPLEVAVSWLHPRDRRPIFAYPWEGATVFGTTDLDHDQSLDAPRMSAAERDYLMEGLHAEFPQLALSAKEAISCYAGVRPVVSSGQADPSAESRESAQWVAPGLIGITGGKLTTFRVTAREVLRAAAQQLPQLMPASDEAPVFAPIAEPSEASAVTTRLRGRLGQRWSAFLAAAPAADMEPIGETPYTWAELRWAVAQEQVVHLEDLMMRRTRLGLISPQGGAAFLERIGGICRETLGWDDVRWQQERQAYLDYWARAHAPVTEFES